MCSKILKSNFYYNYLYELISSLPDFLLTSADKDIVDLLDKLQSALIQRISPPEPNVYDMEPVYCVCHYTLK